ncbi:hypothetical protein M5689_024323 [Euphorbia peplus]|nr:hypothetical protein M5689_024323 [Euphorbia peplus]
MDEIEGSNSYEDFEPLCKWQRHNDFNILEVHLPSFKVEELKVRMIENNILVIIGEHSMNNEVRSRFRKEIKISKNIKKEGIHAKFVKAGILYVTMPKKTTSSGSNYEVLQSCNFIMKFKNNSKWILQFLAILLAIAFGSFAYKYFFCLH